jgi:hypothetical protein
MLVIQVGLLNSCVTCQILQELNYHSPSAWARLHLILKLVPMPALSRVC